MRYFPYLFLILLFSSCKMDSTDKTQSSKSGVKTLLTLTQEDRKNLITELKTRFEQDQVALSNYINASDADVDKLDAVKKKVAADNTKRMKELFNKYGFLGWDLVGEEGSHHFWLMVQNSSADTDFQYAVLKEMGPAVESNNAFAPNYAYLTDRVRLNTNKKQIYGTQVSYKENGQAIPRPMVDSLNVNTRRANIAMKSIELYLNTMTKKNFERNKGVYAKRGVKEPALLSIK